MLVVWKKSKSRIDTPWEDIKLNLYGFFEEGPTRWNHPNLRISFVKSYDALYVSKKRVYHSTILNGYLLRSKEEAIIQGILQNTNLAPMYVNSAYKDIAVWALTYNPNVWVR